MIQPYTQTTFETCLACCLVQAVDMQMPVKLSHALELEMITHALNASKADFVIGHLDFITENFNISVVRIVDNEYFMDYLNTLPTPKGVKTEARKITLSLIDSILEERPMLLIDTFYLFSSYHYPHWITILRKEKDTYTIFDTWDGKEKTMSARTLSKAISSLRNHLKMAPQILRLET